MAGETAQYFDLLVADHVGTLTINKPERLNALTAEMVDELKYQCRQIERRDDILVLLITGEGKAFCAGGDIDAWSSETAEDFGRHWIRNGHDAFDALARLRQPVIAVLNGHTLGGGLELAACADYRVAEAHVKIGQPETGLGVIPGWSGTQRAVRRFGAQAVRKMALFGKIYTAEEALSDGLVDLIAEKGEGLSAAHELAHAVVARGAEATELTKMLINAAEGEERERVLEAMAGRIAAGSVEIQEGLTAFKDKRKPKFPMSGTTKED
ncbi:MAG: enoyl-CoA hydratase/isomerase family protein [Hyphomicrobiales bacterium]